MRWQRGVSRLIGDVSWSIRSRRGPRSGARILLYHAVGTPLEKDTYGISIDPSNFSRHLQTLADDPALDVVPFSEMSPTSDRTNVVLTFDDGYLDTLRTAAPILLDFGIPFTVFVTSGFLDRGHPEYLTVDDLRELATQNGVTIGSHGVTHSLLTKCDADQLRNELVGSRERLEEIIGVPVRSISYPHGDVDERVRTAAIAAGYSSGMCSRFDINRPGRDPMLLCRCEIVADDDLKIFRQKVHGAWDWYRWRHADVS